MEINHGITLEEGGIVEKKEGKERMGKEGQVETEGKLTSF